MKFYKFGNPDYLLSIAVGRRGKEVLRFGKRAERSVQIKTGRVAKGEIHTRKNGIQKQIFQSV